jgi:SIR2-like domain
MTEGPGSRLEEPRGLLVDDLRRQLARGRVVAIVGAGVSVAATRDSPVASWLGLLEDGISRCEELFLTLPDGWGEKLRMQLRSGDIEGLLAVADDVARALGAPRGGEYRRWLRETVGQLEPEQPEVIEALRDLDVRIATTNYDSLIEQVTGQDAVTWKEDARVERVLRGDEPGVLHLHGHWEDPESIVLGIRSYDDVLGDEHAQFVQRAIIAYNSLLFVGCGEGLEDPNFSALRRWLGEIFAGSEYRHFRLALDGEARALAAEHGSAERIAVVPYGERHEDLGPFLRGLHDAVEPRRGPAAPETEVGWLRRHLRPVIAGAVALVAAGILAAVFIPDGGGDGNAVAETIALGASVGPGAPVTGAGEIAEPGERDVYSFSGEDKAITLVNRAPPGGDCPPLGLNWQLVHPGSGDTIFDRSMFNCDAPLDELGYSLRAGPYTLTIYSTDGGTGAYAFTLAPVVEQAFELTVGTTVQPGKPLSGAGEIGQAAELDVYEFSGEGTVTFVNQAPPGGDCPPIGLHWRLVHLDSGDTIFDRSMFNCAAPLDEPGHVLRAGTYTLTVYGANGATGRYRFTLKRS